MTAPAPIKVLIVDDHEPMRALLQAILERAGVRDLRTSGSAREALALLAQAAADLILVDQNMPGMDGVSFIRALRADETLGGVRIIMICGEADAAHAAVACEAGADAVLVKPVGPRELLAAIERVMAA